MIDADFLADSKKKIDAAKAAFNNEKNAVWPFLKNLLEAYGNVSNESSDFNIEYANMLDEVETDEYPEFEYFPYDYEEIIDYSFHTGVMGEYLRVFVSTHQEGDIYNEEIDIPIEYASEKGVETLKELYTDRIKQLEEYKNKKNTEKTNKSLEKKKKQYEKLKKELGLYPDTKEEILREIEETTKYEPKDWNCFLAKNAYLKALNKKLEEMNQ